jgi:creatinine amidohydrolase/Fe(II)-dependent formamide hydrolase-like protein
MINDPDWLSRPPRRVITRFYNTLLGEAADLCRYEGRHLEILHLGTAGMDAHAGRAETSMMLHLAPERVRVDLAEPGVTDPVWGSRSRPELLTGS